MASGVDSSKVSERDARKRLHFAGPGNKLMLFETASPLCGVLHNLPL